MRKVLLAATALTTTIMFLVPGVGAQQGVVDWSGPYIGASIGGAAGTTNFEAEFVSGGTALSPVGVPTLGVSGTITGGFNIQRDQFVYGIAADGTYMTLGGSAQSEPLALEGYSIDTRLDALLSLRGRFCITSGSFLYYGTAGLAAGHVSYNATISSILGGTPTPAVGDGVVFGPTYGIGVEYALNDNISLTTEGMVTNLGPLTATGDAGKGGAFDASARTNSLNVRSGINVRY